MAEFSKLVITNKGEGLIAKALADVASIKFSKVSSSSTVYDVNELEGLEDITDIRQSSPISSISITNKTSVEIRSSFTNTEVIEGYYLRSLGLYAIDPDEGEILYGVTAEISGNCYMPAYNGVTSSGMYFEIVARVGNSEKVSLEINPAAVATIKDLKDIEEKIKIVDFDDSGEVSGIESFTDFMEKLVKGTSIYQIFTNLKAGLKYVLHTGKLVNSGMCETPGEFALDAAYGKYLTDQISQVYSEIQANDVWSYLQDCIDMGYLPDPEQVILPIFQDGAFLRGGTPIINAAGVGGYTLIFLTSAGIEFKVQYAGNGYLYLPDPIDLRSINYLYISKTHTGTSNHLFDLELGSSPQGKELMIVSLNDFKDGTNVIDISAIPDRSKVYINFHWNPVANNNTNYTITSIEGRRN